MKIKPFAVEEWMNAYETGARFNIAETCVDSLSMDELFAISGEDKDAFLAGFCARPLTYGYIAGSPALREGVCGLYRSIDPGQVVPTHGASGANHHVFCSLIAPGDRVVSVVPTYQQLYSIPEAIGADMKILPLEREDGYLPDLKRLRDMAQGAKMICVNNPNNPTGALMPRETLERIADIARASDAYVLCDEVYRHLTQEEAWCESIADIYEKGISVGSMSKLFSLAGLRIGWIATRDETALKSFLSHRDYNLISCGMFDDAAAALALRHKDAIIGRNREIIRENLALLDEWISRSPHFSYVRPQAGTTALVHYDFDIPSYDFCIRLYEETGAFVTPGDCFEQPHSMRIGYACAGRVLREGLAALGDFAAGLE